MRRNTIRKQTHFTADVAQKQCHQRVTASRSVNNNNALLPDSLLLNVPIHSSLPEIQLLLSNQTICQSPTVKIMFLEYYLHLIYKCGN